MDKLSTYFNSSQQYSSVNNQRAKQNEIVDFDYALETIMNDMSEENGCTNSSSVEYLTPFGMIKIEYILIGNSDDETQYQSVHPEVVNAAVPENIDSDRSLHLAGKFSINSIDELRQVFERILTQSVRNDDKHWEFTYIDSSLGRLNMTVKKNRQLHLSFIIKSAQIVEVDLRRIVIQLHDRLSQKGWTSKTDQPLEDCTHSEVVSDKG